MQIIISHKLIKVQINSSGYLHYFRTACPPIPSHLQHLTKKNSLKKTKKQTKEMMLTFFKPTVSIKDVHQNQLTRYPSKSSADIVRYMKTRHGKTRVDDFDFIKCMAFFKYKAAKLLVIHDFWRISKRNYPSNRSFFPHSN